MRTVLFLDIDGVLNSEKWYRQRAGFSMTDPVPAILPSREWTWADEIDPAAVALLNEITDRTGAEIVVSSTWRMSGMEWLEPFLLCRGVTGKIIGATPILGGIRGGEIGAWLTEHPEVNQFVILDDDRDMGSLLPYLVHTPFRYGLTRRHVGRAIEMLQRLAA